MATWRVQIQHDKLMADGTYETQSSAASAPAVEEVFKGDAVNVVKGVGKSIVGIQGTYAVLIKVPALITATLTIALIGGGIQTFAFKNELQLTVSAAALFIDVSDTSDIDYSILKL